MQLFPAFLRIGFETVRWKYMEGYRSGYNGLDSKSKPFFVSLFSESLDITGFFGVSQFHILLVLPIRSLQFLRWADVRNIRSGIEVVITGLTRNQLNRKVPWVRIPPAPPEITPVVGFSGCWLFFFSSVQSPSHWALHQPKSASSCNPDVRKCSP